MKVIPSPLVLLASTRHSSEIPPPHRRSKKQYLLTDLGYDVLEDNGPENS